VTVLHRDECSPETSELLDLPNGLPFFDLDFAWNEIPVGLSKPQASKLRGQPIDLWLNITSPQKNPASSQSPEAFDYC
jgi:hypothetical protein